MRNKLRKRGGPLKRGRGEFWVMPQAQNGTELMDESVNAFHWQWNVLSGGHGGGGITDRLECIVLCARVHVARNTAHLARLVKY